MSIPIFLFHRGNESYLTYSLEQAKLSNPLSEVTLIGYPHNQHYCKNNINHFQIDNYNTSALEFEKIYYHTGPTGYIYNLFCFQRWFILKDVMKAHNLDQACHIDTDVMLYADISNPKFSTVQNPWMCIITVSQVELLCSIIVDHFTNKLEYLIKYTNEIGHPCISDMVLFGIFNDYFTNHITRGFFDDSLFDGNINHPNMFDSADDKKKIYAIDGTLFFKIEDKYYTTNSIHCAGSSKEYMKHFLLSNVNPTGTFFFDYATKQWIYA